MDADLTDFRISTIFFLFCLLLLVIPAGAQVPVPTLEAQEYPAGSPTETRLEAALATFFEDTEVGNLHVYASGEEVASRDFYFHGEEMPNSFLPSMDPQWRAEMPRDMQLYGVYMIRGYDEPYYVVRVEGQGLKNAIELFAMRDTMLHHKATLARLWCSGEQCIQEDAWLQDVNGDTFLDVIKKVRIYEGPARNTLLSEYQTLLVQDDSGDFYPTSSVPVQWNDYRMQGSEDYGG